MLKTINKNYVSLQRFFRDDEEMNLSETIIKIHSIAAERVGELEADELVTSLLVVVLNDLKKNGELNPENLIEAFKKKQELVELAHLDIELKRPKLYLVSHEEKPHHKHFSS